MSGVNANGVFSELKEELTKQKQSALENVEELLYVTEQKDAELGLLKEDMATLEENSKAEANALVRKLELEEKALAGKSTEVDALKAELRTTSEARAEGEAKRNDVERKFATQTDDFEKCRQALLDAQRRHASEVESLKRSLQELAQAAEANHSAEAEEHANLAAVLERAARKEQEFAESSHELTMQKQEAMDKVSELSDAYDKSKAENQSLRDKLEVVQSRLSQAERQQKTAVDGKEILKLMDIKGLAMLPFKDNPDAQPDPAFFLDSPLADVPGKAMQSVEALSSAYIELESEAERLTSLVTAQGAEVHNKALADFDRRLSSLLHKAEELDQVDATGVEAVKELVASAQQASNLRRFTVDQNRMSMLHTSGNFQASKAAYEAGAGNGGGAFAVSAASSAAAQPLEGTAETTEDRKDPVVQSWRWGRLSAVALHLELKRTRRAAVRKSRVPLHWAKIMSLCQVAMAEAFHKRNLKLCLLEMREISGKWKTECDPLRRGAMNPYTSRYEWLWMLFSLLIDHRVTAKARGAAIVMGPAKKQLIAQFNDLFLRKWMRFVSWVLEANSADDMKDFWSAAYRPKKCLLANTQVQWANAQVELEELQIEASKLLPAEVVYRWCHLTSRLKFLSEEHARLESIMLRQQRNERTPTPAAPLPIGGDPVETRAMLVEMRWMRVVGVLVHFVLWEASYGRGKRERTIEMRAADSWRRFSHFLLMGGVVGTIDYSIAKAAVQRRHFTAELLARDDHISVLFQPAELAWARMALSFSRLHLAIDFRCHLLDGVRVMWARAEGYRNSALVAGRRARLHAMHAMTAHQVMHDDLQHRLQYRARSKSPVHHMEEALQEKCRAQLERSRALFAQEDAAQSLPHGRIGVGKTVNGKATNGTRITRVAARPSSTSPSPTPTLLKSHNGRVPKAD